MNDQRDQAVRELRRIADKLESGAGGFVEYSTDLSIRHHEPTEMYVELHVVGITPEELR